MAAAYGYSALRFWRQRVQAWYPDYLRRPYMQPAVFMNRTRHQTVQYADQDVYVPEPPVFNQPRLPRGAARPALPPLLESDVRDDSAQVKVLRCLQEMPSFQNEIMFIISQLDFGDYLNQPAAKYLPRPIDLRAFQKHRGDFDVLIIHRLYGIFVGDVRVIGDSLSTLSQQQQEVQIAKRVKKAMQNLQKDVDMLRHLVSDQASAPRIQTTLMVPNLSSAQLQYVLATNPQLRQDLCQRLGIPQTEDPLPLCLTADTLSNPGLWWQQRVIGSGPDPAMSDEVYLDLISRFCGPASTVRVACTSLPRLHLDVRTEGQGVEETAWQFTRLVLHPRQLAVLNDSTQRLVILAGPPRCGKSTVLTLKGLDWLRRGKHVQVLSVGSESLAASQMIFGQLQQTAGPAATGRLHLRSFHLDPGSKGYESDIMSALASLTASSENGELFIVADEIARNGKVLEDIISRVPESTVLYFWAASLFPFCRPSGMTGVILTEALRTPPAITREVPDYSVSVSPVACDGLPFHVIDHSRHGYGQGYATDCVVCGQQLAGRLHSLHVGASGISGSTIRFSDVFVVTDTVLPDSINDGLVRGLRQAGIPVSVISKGDERAVAAVVCRTGPDHVVAASYEDVMGLERAVVVYVDCGKASDVGRLNCMSRSTAMLVWIKGGWCTDADLEEDREYKYLQSIYQIEQMEDYKTQDKNWRPRNDPENDPDETDGWTSLHLACYYDRVMDIRKYVDIQPTAPEPPATASQSGDASTNEEAVDENATQPTKQEVEKDEAEDAGDSTSTQGNQPPKAPTETPEDLAETDKANPMKLIKYEYPPSPLNCQTEDGETPLFVASERGHVRSVRRLLMYREAIDVNLADNAGRTPLFIASERGHHGVVSQLMEFGAEINKPDKDGKTPLNMALEKMHGDVVEVLLPRADEEILYKRDA